MRDLLRRLQVLRKDSGLEIEDRIHLRWTSDSERIARAFERWGEHMAAELLCLSCERVDTLEQGKTLKADGEKLTVTIDKAEPKAPAPLRRRHLPRRSRAPALNQT